MRQKTISSTSETLSYHAVPTEPHVPYPESTASPILSESSASLPLPHHTAFSERRPPHPAGSSSAPRSCASSEQRFFCCYLLRSKSHPSSSYIGFTVNLKRRIRQHNGEVAKGGARKTRKYRPWEAVACVYGFESKIFALQFEWAWQHPTSSRMLKHGCCPRRNGHDEKNDLVSTVENEMKKGGGVSCLLPSEWCRLGSPRMRESSSPTSTPKRKSQGLKRRSLAIQRVKSANTDPTPPSLFSKCECDGSLCMLEIEKDSFLSRQPPETNWMTSPQTNLITSPQTNLITSPQTNLITSPETNWMTSPQTNLITSPETNWMTSPQTSSVTSPLTKPVARKRLRLTKCSNGGRTDPNTISPSPSVSLPNIACSSNRAAKQGRARVIPSRIECEISSSRCLMNRIRVLWCLLPCFAHTHLHLHFFDANTFHGTFMGLLLECRDHKKRRKLSSSAGMVMLNQLCSRGDVVMRWSGGLCEYIFGLQFTVPNNVSIQTGSLLDLHTQVMSDHVRQKGSDCLWSGEEKVSSGSEASTTKCTYSYRTISERIVGETKREDRSDCSRLGLAFSHRSKQIAVEADAKEDECILVLSNVGNEKEHKRKKNHEKENVTFTHPPEVQVSLLRSVNDNETDIIPSALHNTNWLRRASAGLPDSSPFQGLFSPDNITYNGASCSDGRFSIPLRQRVLQLRCIRRHQRMARTSGMAKKKRFSGERRAATPRRRGIW